MNRLYTGFVAYIVASSVAYGYQWERATPAQDETAAWATGSRAVFSMKTGSRHM